MPLTLTKNTFKNAKKALRTTKADPPGPPGPQKNLSQPTNSRRFFRSWCRGGPAPPRPATPTLPTTVVVGVVEAQNSYKTNPKRKKQRRSGDQTQKAPVPASTERRCLVRLPLRTPSPARTKTHQNPLEKADIGRSTPQNALKNAKTAFRTPNTAPKTPAVNSQDPTPPGRHIFPSVVEGWACPSYAHPSTTVVVGVVEAQNSYKKAPKRTKQRRYLLKATTLSVKSNDAPRHAEPAGKTAKSPPTPQTAPRPRQ